jgi:hypothetical protein
VTLTYSDLNLVGQDHHALCDGSCPKSRTFARNNAHTLREVSTFNLNIQFSNFKRFKDFKFQGHSKFDPKLCLFHIGFSPGRFAHGFARLLTKFSSTLPYVYGALIFR